jgi:hypothetical protein
MNGTTQPSGGTDLATLNPCPLNVCCNIWGQCGMTDDFCVISKSETGAPGTSAPGKNGCKCSSVRDIVAWISSTEILLLVVVSGVDG